MIIGKAFAEQAAIALAPPLLVLWFGWDVWFAAAGFLQPGKRPQDDAGCGAPGAK
jgi:hypothetical protein